MPTLKKKNAQLIVDFYLLVILPFRSIFGGYFELKMISTKFLFVCTWLHICFMRNSLKRRKSLCTFILGFFFFPLPERHWVKALTKDHCPHYCPAPLFLLWLPQVPTAFLEYLVIVYATPFLALSCHFSLPRWHQTEKLAER